ncbi:MAG: hypothetical protein KME23_07270 [Goleter apudmare HA4340-LM2]|jgi:hypothetical protein|nr:hypothetical protein [Goleter apudmare HA4340-LM2]
MAESQFPKRLQIGFERLIAITAVVNLCLVLFNLSYLPWRDFYWRKFPQITRIYDPIKGIEPHRDTTNYLETVAALEEQVSQTGLNSTQARTKLEELSRLSTEMIDGNVFTVADKIGTLEKIKNRMRSHVGKDSAKQALNTFWSQEYLSQQGWKPEINFFNQQIKPLISTNYYRRIGENGEFLDEFWLIDLPFIALFALELLIRTAYIRRRYTDFSWLDAVLWRWYDIFLLLPFWRWLRVIPVLIRLDQAQLLNLHPIRQRIHQGILTNFAEEITELVVVRVINQIQGSIKRGDFTRWLSQQENLRPYIDINDVNEIEAIANLLVQTVVYEVLPKIQPEIIAILRHNIDTVLYQVPIYRNLQTLPGVGQAQTQISEQLATQITTNLYNALVSAINDPVSAKLTSQLVQRFSQALSGEVQKKQLLTEIQSLFSDFLEEVKLNYVQRLSQEDIDQILNQTRQLRTQVVGGVLPGRK